MNLNFENFNASPELISKTIVKLSTQSFKRGNQYFHCKVLTTLKRKSEGFNILEDEIQHEIQDLDMIEGLYTLSDGEYQLVYGQTSPDYETGHCDIDSYNLIPLEDIKL